MQHYFLKKYSLRFLLTSELSHKGFATIMVRPRPPEILPKGNFRRRNVKDRLEGVASPGIRYEDEAASRSSASLGTFGRASPTTMRSACFLHASAHTPHPMHRSRSTRGLRSFRLVPVTRCPSIRMAVTGQARAHLEQPRQASRSNEGTKPLGLTALSPKRLMD